jgi:hypothetical protein
MGFGQSPAEFGIDPVVLISPQHGRRHLNLVISGLHLMGVTLVELRHPTLVGGAGRWAETLPRVDDRSDRQPQQEVDLAYLECRQDLDGNRPAAASTVCARTARSPVDLRQWEFE